MWLGGRAEKHKTRCGSSSAVVDGLWTKVQKERESGGEWWGQMGEGNHCANTAQGRWIFTCSTWACKVLGTLQSSLQLHPCSPGTPVPQQQSGKAVGHQEAALLSWFPGKQAPGDGAPACIRIHPPSLTESKEPCQHSEQILLLFSIRWISHFIQLQDCVP